ncbi:MAG: hypothetical protein ACK5LZ_06500 [Anaerorhabdus sp.]
MIVPDILKIPPSALYHQLRAVKIDDLQNFCTNKVKVDQDDCYALVVSVVEEEELQFEILSIGKTPDTCDKGLEIKESLGALSYVFMLELRSVVVLDLEGKYQPKVDMIIAHEGATPKELEIRNNILIDELCIRNHPDYAPAIFLSEENIHPSTIKMIDIDGPKVTGIVVDESIEDIPGLDLEQGDEACFYVIKLGDREQLVYEQTILFPGNGSTLTVGEVFDEMSEKLKEKETKKN